MAVRVSFYQNGKKSVDFEALEISHKNCFKRFQTVRGTFSSPYSFVSNTKKCLQLFETFWSNFCGKFPTPQSPHFFSRFDKKIPKLPWLDGISELAVRKLNPSQDQTAINRLISTSFDRSIINITHLHTMLSRLYLALLHSQHVNNNIGNKISD